MEEQLQLARRELEVFFARELRAVRDSTTVEVQAIASEIVGDSTRPFFFDLDAENLAPRWQRALGGGGGQAVCGAGPHHQGDLFLFQLRGEFVILYTLYILILSYS